MQVLPRVLNSLGWSGNTLTCHFRVFGTIFFVAYKQAEFLQSELADVILV